MAKIPQVLEQMLAIWNESDSSKIEAGVNAVFSEDVVFIDPTHSITGRAAFVEMVREFRSSNPDAVCSRSSGVDAHHGLHRYHWEIHRNGELLLPGFDVAEVNEEGFVRRVEGFFGPIPEPG